MNDREKNKHRIRELHQALRWAALGECLEKFKGCTLDGLAAEIKGRMAIELVYLQHDPPPPVVVDGVTFVYTPPKEPNDPRLN